MPGLFYHKEIFKRVTVYVDIVVNAHNNQHKLTMCILSCQQKKCHSVLVQSFHHQQQ